MVEVFWSMEGLPQSRTVLDVRPETHDPGVENIAEGVLPQKQIAQHPHTPTHLGLSPQLTQLSYSAYAPLLAPHIPQQIDIGDPTSLRSITRNRLVLLDEVEDAFAEVFRYVLGVILKSMATLFLG